MSKQWDNKNIQTLDEITTYNNLFVEIENAAYAATFIGNPSQYAHPWQIVFLPAYNQIWTQGDFYGTNSYEYEKTIARLQAQDEALGQAIGDIATYSYITPEMLGENVPQNVTNIENYLYSYISKEIDKLNKELTSSYTSVKYAAYDAANAYVTVSYEHNDATGTAYTVELHNAAAYSYVQSAYAYIEQQITDINKDINDTSISITYDAPVEGKAYVTASVVENENFPGVTYNLSLHNVSSYTDMISYVNERITSLVDGAPDALDTLKEIANWISEGGEDTTYLITRVQNLEAADAAIISGYEAAIQNLKDNSYIYVSYDGTNTTAIHHGETIVVTGSTVKGVAYENTTGTINEAIAALESKINTLSAGGITKIISDGSIDTELTADNTYTVKTDASKIKTTAAGEYFSANDSVQTALNSIDAQVKTNTTDIATNAANIEAILEALNWTIVN